MTAGHFYRAQPLTRQTWGSVICARADFLAIDGYDETYGGWGGEDDDLVGMLMLTGRQPAPFPAALLEEIRHTNEMRSRFHPIRDLFLQQRINHTFMQVKFDLLRLVGKTLSPAERRAAYEKIRGTIVEHEVNNRVTPLVIDVAIPGAIIGGPPGNDGRISGEVAVLQRELTYTLRIEQHG